jgi:hypothetical protein
MPLREQKGVVSLFFSLGVACCNHITNRDGGNRHSARRKTVFEFCLFFILTLVLGTSALTRASFATQVPLTKQAAARVIRAADAPSLR